jgi:hypothetical protein
MAPGSASQVSECSPTDAVCDEGTHGHIFAAHMHVGLRITCSDLEPVERQKAPSARQLLGSQSLLEHWCPPVRQNISTILIELTAWTYIDPPPLEQSDNADS